MRVPVIVVAPVAINILIVFKTFPQVLQVFSCVGKCWIKGHQIAPSSIGLIPCICFVLHLKVVGFIFMLVNSCVLL